MPHMKDEMKKKDSEKLEEMQKEINEAKDDQELAAESNDDVDNADITKNEADDAALLEAQIEEGKKALTEAEERFKRLQADFVNFRRRSNQEKSEISEVILQGFVKDMLPVLDNFERAITTESNDSTAFVDGVKMIFNQFQEILTKNGLEVIKTEGAKFDPNFHQAVMRVEDAEKEDDSIEQELQKGYMVHGRVIRPAMVKVVSN
ncbi:nucleotide exchange factor GrpE [Pectinatus cerevisiiphilus]|uniref:Protein GrpE n=1 Tax=Pectinatus cerevisiiphilus TaxID=86956 RepID=A0A4R3K547_9FIRM|nr:nucleotide exchange factor GrpE [Pectinatus cerevisiiphilus]TCS77827.1 molecular chaperone GrpE [Pectinatus cerevisiiphilus]